MTVTHPQARLAELADEIFATNTERVSEFLLVEIEKTAQAVLDAIESFNETRAQHHSECALYGDSWPGAQFDLRIALLGVKRAELDAEIAVLRARREGYITYDEAVAHARAQLIQTGELTEGDGDDLPF